MTLPLLVRASAGPTLRPYQQDAVAAILERWRAGDRATLLVLATGLGKTICFADIVRRAAMDGKRSLIIAHRAELLEQAEAKLLALGLDVAIEQAERRAGVHSTVVASVQTMQGPRLKRWAPDHFDVLVVDEAHHAASASYRRILDHFAAAKVLGVTATPDRADGHGLGAIFDSVSYRYEISDGIKAGWLAPIKARRVLVDGLDLSAVRTTAGDLNQGDLDLAMRAPESVHGVAAPLVALSEDRQTILFAVTVEHAHALAEAINEISPGAAIAVDGSASREHRADVLRRYQSGEIRVLVNCALYTEGFDAPATSCIAIARPTTSRGLYAQMVGRGTRLAAGKTSCLLLDFAGVAGKHKLVGPADVLAGRALDDDERAEVERILTRGGDPADVILALDEAVEAARRKREAPKPIAWTSIEVDLFGDDLNVGLREEWAGQPLTGEQREYLTRKGVDWQRLDRAHASVLIEALQRRQAMHLCTYKQARALARYGIKPDRITFAEASALIDSLARQRWRPSSAWLAAVRARAEGVGA